jgi:hypothetical protein
MRIALTAQTRKTERMLPAGGPTRNQVLRVAVNIAKCAEANRNPDPDDVALLRSVAPAEMKACPPAELAHYIVEALIAERRAKE